MFYFFTFWIITGSRIAFKENAPYFVLLTIVNEPVKADT